MLLGTLSYSIYMLQSFLQERLIIIGKLVEAFFDLRIPRPVTVDGKQLLGLGTELWHGDLAYVGMLLIVIGSSYITYNLIEAPARRWFRRLTEQLWPDNVNSMRVVKPG